MAYFSRGVITWCVVSAVDPTGEPECRNGSIPAHDVCTSGISQ